MTVERIRNRKRGDNQGELSEDETYTVVGRCRCKQPIRDKLPRINSEPFPAEFEYCLVYS